MSTTSTKNEIKKYIQTLQSVVHRMRLNADEEHVAVKILAFSSGESDHHADRNDQHDLGKYKIVFGTNYGFHNKSFIIPSTKSAVKLTRFTARAKVEHCESYACLDTDI
jgi:hypothetical protein